MNAWTDAQYEKLHPTEWEEETKKQTLGRYNALI
jgi:hypothetical protein